MEYMQTKRSLYLYIVGVAVLFVIIFGIAWFSNHAHAVSTQEKTIVLQLNSTSTYANVKSYGAKGDGVTDDAAAFKKVFAANLNGKIYIPDGTYIINNSNGPLVIRNFSGDLLFASQAKLVFTDPTKQALNFIGGSNATIENLTTDYYPVPTRRIGDGDINISSTTDMTITDAYINHSPSAGILFISSIRPKATNIRVTNSLADGLSFANCQDPYANNVNNSNTGDDGLSFISYVYRPDYTGGTATNITITGSHARGITIAGQSGMTISNFTVSSSTNAGVIVLHDVGFHTRQPANDTISDGVIKNSHQYGIQYSDIISATFNNITAISSRLSGFYGTSASGTINASNIDSKSNGLRDAINLQALNVFVNNLTSEQSPGYGIIISHSGTVVANNLTATNASTASDLHRAIWFEDNKNVSASGLTIVDNQKSATGYILGEYSNASGTITDIHYQISNGKFAVSNLSKSVKFGEVNSHI
jgi:hypothetical protein